MVMDTAPATKIDAIERLGATIVPATYDECWRTVEAHGSPRMRGHFVHPFDDDRFIAGNGTLGLEILEDLPDVDAVVGAARRRRPARAASRSAIARAAARRADRRRRAGNGGAARDVARATAAPAASTAGSASFVDGAGGKSVLPTMWPLLSRLVDGSIVVPLADVAAAMKLVADRCHVIAEGAAACAVAAALTGRVRGKIVAIVSGGNIDLPTFASLGCVTSTCDAVQCRRLRLHGLSLRICVDQLPDRINRLDELAHDLWWSWNAGRAQRLPPPRLPAVAADRAQPGAHAAADPAGDARRARSPIPSGWRTTTAPSPGSTPRARRTTPGARRECPELRGQVDRLLLRRVRAAPVAADLRRRPRRAGRRSLQGSQRPRRAAHRRRLHVSAGLLPPEPLGRRLAAGDLREAELDRRARSSRRSRPTASRASPPCRSATARCSWRCGACASAA